MRSLAPYLVTLPLLVAPMGEMWLKPALAQSMNAEQALEFLARSAAADAKCHHLNAGDREELADYLARAEIAETGRSSPEEAKSIIASGRSAGQESLCGEDSRAEVEATLGAARDAMDQGDRRDVAEPDPVPAQPIERPQVAARSTPVPATSAKDGLARYGEAAMAYYVERRCGHLSNAKARDFWNGVVAQHNAMLNAYRRRDVAAVLTSAEANANRQSCGTRTAALVEAAYAGISRH
jgi:hypothetical protein